ncbi:hypothetical protein E3N88_06106 [Mikania micrantha]|uniref:Uncharacterized protein n=1 Tax=Mikania micrantha TaxID=192012 RepID=A0A5N6PQ61_9ASTR|nr:hypothetical protein E3N88_06106 [Mikania micrantha]
MHPKIETKTVKTNVYPGQKERKKEKERAREIEIERKRKRRQRERVETECVDRLRSAWVVGAWVSDRPYNGLRSGGVEKGRSRGGVEKKIGGGDWYPVFGGGRPVVRWWRG